MTGLFAAEDTYTDPPQFCEKRNSYIVCTRARGHTGRHGTEIGGEWFYWDESGKWGTCGATHAAHVVYCGREKDHEGEHMAASCLGMILGRWA